MRTPFGATWDDLELSHLEAFFADLPPGGEGLTWEAKGTAWPNAGSVRKHACGFANQLGGFLVVGAAQTKGAWAIPGVPAPAMNEPKVWLTQVARDGLDPAPFMDAKVFRAGTVEEPTLVAVLLVDQVAAPPCMTDGRVFQRVTGETVPVSNPSVLAGLIQRGREADERAYNEANFVAQMADPLVDGPAEALAGLALSIAPVAPRAGIDRRVFTRAAEAAMIDSLAEAVDMPRAWLGGRVAVQHSTLSSRVTLGREDQDEEVWSAQCTVLGGVGVAWYQLGAMPALRSVDRASTLEGPWEAASRIVKALGGAGPGWIGASHWVTDRLVPAPPPSDEGIPTTLHRAADLGDPMDLEDVLRGLKRASGQRAYEPNPDPVAPPEED